MSDWKQRLREAGLRVTAPRLAILDLFDAPETHLDAESVARSARDRLGALSTQAVYDNLHMLTQAGLLRCTAHGGGPARYEARVGDNHHHLICRRCGATHDIDCVVGEVPCLEPSNTHGFSIDEAEVTFWGLCPDCRAASRKGTP